MTEIIEGRAVPGPAEPRPAGQASPRSLRYERIALVDLLDRLLAGGVVISGEVRLAIADVDLVNVTLRALISSVSTVLEHARPDLAERT
jgi:hypothetical protein